ncbi:MAG: hypothetical protein ACFFAN_08190 [Promethearchaeota archaeon]
MIFQEVYDEEFRFLDFWDALEMGLYFVIVGYYFLIFAYFLVMRYRTSKKLYWLFFSLLFLFFAAGRVFFIGYYFFIPELEGTLSDKALISTLMLYYKLATFFSWMGIACAMGLLGILLFPPEAELDQNIAKKEESKRALKITLSNNMKIFLRIVLIVIPIIVGILVLVLPDNLFIDPDIAEKYDYNGEVVTINIGFGPYPIGRFILNIILLPLLAALIPFIFLYLALKTFGVLRKSYALNAIGFFLYYLGRITQGFFETLRWHHIQATIPPLMILCSLLIIVIANNYEQLR